MAELLAQAVAAMAKLASGMSSLAITGAERSSGDMAAYI